MLGRCASCAVISLPHICSVVLTAITVLCMLYTLLWTADVLFPTVFDVPAAARRPPLSASSFVYLYWEPSPPPPPSPAHAPHSLGL